RSSSPRGEVTSPRRGESLRWFYTNRPLGPVRGTMNPPQFDEQLPRSPLAPGLARRAVVSWFRDALTGEQLDTTKLLTSELVANAVVHGRGQIILRGGLDEDRVL